MFGVYQAVRDFFRELREPQKEPDLDYRPLKKAEIERLPSPARAFYLKTQTPRDLI